MQTYKEMKSLIFYVSLILIEIDRISTKTPEKKTIHKVDMHTIEWNRNLIPYNPAIILVYRD